MRAAISRAIDSTKTAWIAVAVGLALRLALLAIVGSRPLSDDAADYHAMAVGLLDGSRISTDWPPGVALWLLPFYAVFGSGVLVAPLLPQRPRVVERPRFDLRPGEDAAG